MKERKKQRQTGRKKETKAQRKRDKSKERQNGKEKKKKQSVAVNQFASIQETKKPIVRKLYHRMQQFAEQDPTVLDPSLAVHERKCLSENYVFFGYRTTADSWRQLDCSIVTSPQRVFQDSMAFHLQKGSPYTPLFSAE